MTASIGCTASTCLSPFTFYILQHQSSMNLVTVQLLNTFLIQIVLHQCSWLERHLHTLHLLVPSSSLLLLVRHLLLEAMHLFLVASSCSKLLLTPSPGYFSPRNRATARLRRPSPSCRSKTGSRASAISLE